MPAHRHNALRAAALATVLPLAASLCDAATAFAQNPRQVDDLAALLPAPNRKRACFARAYDANHLTAHRAQRVTAIVLALHYRHDPAPRDPDPFGFALSLKRRADRRALSTAGNCRTLQPLDADFLAKLEPAQRAALEKERSALRGGPALECYVECDGGGIIVERAGDAAALLVHLDRIRMANGCGEEENAIEVTGGSDDRVFRLDQAPPAMCRSLDRQLQ